jgi:hypothetical protein
MLKQFTYLAAGMLESTELDTHKYTKSETVSDSRMLLQRFKSNQE